MKKFAKKYLNDVCEKWGIKVPECGTPGVQAYMEEELRKKGLKDFEIRQEFSSDWEGIIC